MRILKQLNKFKFINSTSVDEESKPTSGATSTARLQSLLRAQSSGWCISPSPERDQQCSDFLKWMRKVPAESGEDSRENHWDLILPPFRTFNTSAAWPRPPTLPRNPLTPLMDCLPFCPPAKTHCNIQYRTARLCRSFIPQAIRLP